LTVSWLITVIIGWVFTDLITTVAQLGTAQR